MKYLAYLMTALMLVTTAEARKYNKAAAAAAKRAEQQKQKERRERERKYEALKKFLDAKDPNHDGSVSLEEYLAGEANAGTATKKFEKYNKNHDRYLSKSEISDMLGL